MNKNQLSELIPFYFCTFMKLSVIDSCSFALEGEGGGAQFPASICLSTEACSFFLFFIVLFCFDLFFPARAGEVTSLSAFSWLCCRLGSKLDREKKKHTSTDMFFIFCLSEVLNLHN